MARVRLLQKEDASPDAGEIFTRMEANGAKIINLYRVLAHSPHPMLNFIRLGGALVAKAELPSRLRELVILRIASVTGAKYEWAQHYPIAMQVGITQKQTDAVPHWKASKEFNAEERAVLQYTDDVLRNKGVTDVTFNALRSFLDERQIVELTLSIAYWEMVAHVLVPLQVDIDADTIGSAEELIGRGK
ncbi:MAG: carboxymuconolactone decarboxylase family protein [Chloroflexi bacterium]|nr:carboxymuconolactone decarboxylase family protein [Chloroflexota bacterium]